VRRWPVGVRIMTTDRTTPAFMDCGCAASGVDTKTREPVCLTHGERRVIPAPDLTGRQAKCSYGAHKILPSNVRLAFFKHHPDKELDEYYCGCFGWD